ncbi:GntR family transcriptional regulator [Fodinicola feengrottensis]|uniref:GntR family transcriptional regulator n=2 Tax=Fodinicola feengrottensis TaxID=435914 RepID=UPI0013D870D7|nr:GntR family transcriptional regulator [Fodinicola feengrottensis]
MTSPVRYREIADQLRDAIMNEERLVVEGVEFYLKGGAKLPTEPELGVLYSVSRGTIRQALKELSSEGLLETRGRAGTFIRRLPMLAHSGTAERPDRKGKSDSWSAEVERAGGQPSQDFSFRIVAATSGVARRLEIEANALVVVRDCFRYVDNVPWAQQISYYPYDVAQAAKIDVPTDIEEGTVRALAKAGYREVRWLDEVSARAATREEATAFRLGGGMFVLYYQRTGWTNERPIRLTREILPADRNIVTYEQVETAAIGEDS